MFRGERATEGMKAVHSFEGGTGLFKDVVACRGGKALRWRAAKASSDAVALASADELYGWRGGSTRARASECAHFSSLWNEAA